MALSSVRFDSSHRLLCSQHATCELNVTLTRREFTGWRGKRIHSHLLCQKNKAITTVIYHTVKLSSVSDPDTICTKPRCSYFHFKAVFACEYTTSEWRLYRGEGIWKQILYIYILYICSYIHILHKYRLFATSEHVLNSQLEIKGKQKNKQKYIYIYMGWKTP